MEIYVGIGVAVLVIAIFAMLATSMLGIKEKSYEEALAEQRQQTNDLLGVQHKPKTKEKKQKKTGKKVKEKPSAVVTTETDVTEPDSDHLPHNKTHHVEFKEQPEMEEPTKEHPKKHKASQKSKKDKMRPILVNRRDSSNSGETSPVVGGIEEDIPENINHFEESHPKDDLELLHLHEDAKEQLKPKTKASIESEPPNPSSKTSKKVAKQQQQQQQQVVTEVVMQQQKAAPVQQELPQVVEQVAVVATPVAATPESVAVVTATAPPSVVAVKDKKKKKGDSVGAGDKLGGGVTLATLMPMVRNAELSRSEVQKFIDMLLNKQLEAPSVVDDWSEGKADPLQKLKKQLAEKEKLLAEEQEAKLGAQAKVVQLREELNGERAVLTQRNKTLEETLQGKLLEVQTTRATQQQQLVQIQQMQAQLTDAGKLCEEHVSLQRQCRELEMAASQRLESEAAMLSQLRGDSQELQAVNGKLNLELCAAVEQVRRLTDAQQLYQSQLEGVTREADRKDAIFSELDQARRNAEHQHKADMSSMNTVFQQQSEELRKLEFANSQIMAESKKQRDESDRLIGQLRAELAQSLESRANGAQDVNDAHQVELRNLENELSSVKGALTSSAQTHQRQLEELQLVLQEQREKNNALRERNWKVMEALNVAENRNKQLSSPAKPQPEVISQIREEESQACRQFIKRLFPDVKISADNLTQAEWYEETQSVVQNVMDSFNQSKSTESKLQAKVNSLQKVIVDSDAVLQTLQNHIEKEEINWHNQLKEKDEEIARLQQDTKLQIQVTDLQLELSAEQEAHKKSQELIITLQKDAENFANIADMSQEEVNRLQLALEEEKTKIAQQKAQNILLNNINKNTQNNCNTINGPAVTEQLSSTTSSTASSITEISVKKNKKKKKKSNGN